MLALAGGPTAAPPVIYMTQADHHRLSSLVGSNVVGLRGAELLAEELDRAVLVDPGHAPRFARLGSRVRYEDCASRRVREVTLVLPDAADIDQDRVSVFTPVGAALLGMTVGEAFTWTADGRVRELRILEVTDDAHAA